MTPVALVMTVFNAPAAWIYEAAGSVVVQLEPFDEMIIVDDGSTLEETREAVSKLSACATVFWADHRGIGPASNAGIEITSAPLIARLDADDAMLPGTIARLRAHLVEFPQVDVISGGMIYVGPVGDFIGEVRREPMHASEQHRASIVHSGCMFRRELWEHLGGYPDMRAPDWHFWEAAQAAGARFSVIDEFVIRRRIHPDSATFARSRHLQQWWKKAST